MWGVKGMEKRGWTKSLPAKGVSEERLHKESCVGRNGNPTVLGYWLGPTRKSVASAQSLKEQIAGMVS